MKKSVIQILVIEIAAAYPKIPSIFSMKKALLIVVSRLFTDILSPNFIM